MDYNDNMYEEVNFSDLYMGEQDNSLDLNMDKTKKRATKKDRSDSKYSEEDFMKLARAEQKELADKYWMGKTTDFDDGTFKFSYTHFAKLCQKLGFRKGVIDTLEENALLVDEDNSPEIMIYIDHNRRENTEIKKFTFSTETIEKMEYLLGNNLSNIEKSKVIDVLFSEILDEKIAAKDKGRFGVAYRPTEEKRIL